MDISKEIKSAIDELDYDQLRSAKKCVEDAKKKGNVGRPSGVPTEEAALRSYLRKAKLAVPGKRGRGTLEATKEVLQKRMDFLIREYKLTQSVLNEVFEEDIEKIKAKEDIVLGPTYKKRESDKKSAAENEVKRVKEIAESKEIIWDKRHNEHGRWGLRHGPIPTRPKYDESTKIAAAEDLEKAKKKLAKLAKAEEKRLKELKDIEDQRGITLEKEKEREEEELEQMEKEELEQRKIMKQRDKEQKEKEKKKIDEAEEKRLSDIRQKQLNERFAMEREEIKQKMIMKEQKEKELEKEEIDKRMKKYKDLLEKSKENESSETYNKLIKGYDSVISSLDRFGVDSNKFEVQHKTYLKERKERKELLKKENKEIEDLLEKFKEGGYKSRKQAEELSKSSKANKYPDYTPKIKKYIGRYNKIVLEKIAKKKELEGSGREGRKSLRQSLVLQLIRPTNLNMNTRDF